MPSAIFHWSSILKKPNLNYILLKVFFVDRQNGIKGIVKLPHTIDTNAKLLVFTTKEKRDEAISLGAHIAGGENLLQDIIEGKLEFNKCIAMTETLPLVMKLARYLGPKGLMPNAKAGTNQTQLIVFLLFSHRNINE